MAEMETLIKLTTEAIAQHAGSAIKIQALTESVAELKTQTAGAMQGFNATQNNIVLALERLNVNIEDHKILHARINDLKQADERLKEAQEAYEDAQQKRMDAVEHSCSKDIHDQTVIQVKNIERIMLAHGIWEIRDGDKAHHEVLAQHERFIRVLRGRIGQTLLVMIILGTCADFVFHRDFIESITNFVKGG